MEEEEEDDEEENNNKPYAQKPKIVPISKIPINQKLLTNINIKQNEKQKITSTTSSKIPYNFNRQRMNFTTSSSNDIKTQNQKDNIGIRKVFPEKKLTSNPGVLSTKNITNKYTIKPSQNSPKSIKTNQNLQNITPQILKTNNSQSNFNSQKIPVIGTKYSSIRKFGDSLDVVDI